MEGTEIEALGAVSNEEPGTKKPQYVVQISHTSGIAIDMSDELTRIIGELQRRGYQKSMKPGTRK